MPARNVQRIRLTRLKCNRKPKSKRAGADDWKCVSFPFLHSFHRNCFFCWYFRIFVVCTVSDDKDDGFVDKKNVESVRRQNMLEFTWTQARTQTVNVVDNDTQWTEAAVTCFWRGGSVRCADAGYDATRWLLVATLKRIAHVSNNVQNFVVAMGPIYFLWDFLHFNQRICDASDAMPPQMP